MYTCEKNPDEDDWGELKRVFKYPQGIKHTKLTIKVDSLSITYWLLDASYLTHFDCKGHTGDMMSFGRGAVLSFLWKQRLNVGSSTEGELVVAYDALAIVQ